MNYARLNPTLLILNILKSNTLEVNFESIHTGLFIVPVIIVAAALSIFLYFRNSDNQNLSFVQKVFLVFLRFLSLTLIGFLLLSPLIERTHKVKQLPVLAVAFDNSQSVKSYQSLYEQLVKSLKDKFFDDYQLDFYSFGEKVENRENFTGTDRRSDYGQVIKQIKNNYVNKNIGALILFGDGIYNQGQAPEDLAPELKFPVYSVGVGDTVRKIDAIIRTVKTNKIAFLKNKFPVEIELNFLKLKNKIAYLDIENNHHTVFSTTVSVGSDDDFKLEFVNLDASEVGLQHYKVKIRPFEGEANLKNNEFEFVIDVLNNKQKILLLSDGPHPDLGAIRNSLDLLQNYDIKVITGNEVPDSLSAYSLIVLNQIPSAKNTASKLLSRIKESRVPVLFLVGPNSLLDQLNSLDMGLKVSAGSNLEEVQAMFDNNFGLFVLSDETREIFRTSPPLIAPFGNTEVRASLQTLAKQSVKNVPTSKTLMAFGSEHGKKTGFIVGEGLWRWRLYDFQIKGNHEAFDELVQKIVQYMALKQNEDNFNVYHPAVFQETDQVELSAELYNDSYQLVNTPDVSIRIKNNSNEFSYLFDRKDDYYVLNAGNLEPGDYTYEAETKLGIRAYTEKGNFSIVKNDIEEQNNQADFSVLYNISAKSGGKFSSFENYGTLLDSIKNNKQIRVQHYKQTLQSELINIKLMFFLLILFLGVEWFFRKYWGIY
jgi:hypothetical protein